MAKRHADAQTQRYFGMSASDMIARLKRQEEQIAALKAENFKLRDLNADLERRLPALKDELNDYRDKEARREHGFPPRRLQP